MKIRTTVSIHPGLMAHAKQMMADNHFSEFSGFLEQLLRDRWALEQGRRKCELAPEVPPVNLN